MAKLYDIITISYPSVTCRNDRGYHAILLTRLGSAPPAQFFNFGNFDLLSLHKTALFCSARCPGMDKAGCQGARLSLLLPSPMNLRRLSGLFDTDDLLARYPEVSAAAEAFPELVSGRERRNKIFFACHAVSMAKKHKTSIIGGYDGTTK